MIQTAPAAPTSREQVLFTYTGSGCGGHASHVLAGDTIFVRDEIDCFCFATPPAYNVRFVMGPFAPGEYTVRYELYVASAVNDCGPPVLRSAFSQPFVVSEGVSQSGSAHHSVPTIGGASIIVLLLVVAGIAAARISSTRHD
ncbi:hypothetical protein [Chiayiivirga flava]|uniref:Uncharacterized protein n=1 Tax=Chiayiivirga flava TaxID=659595 RepID=A0A7W8D754_9GAMM|nr:hypothetical protein [Chiayiivirga flava]MBB5208035.1 hypothetical protein [Chiayiivirga flava]